MNMKVFFNNTNIYNVGFQAGAKSPKIASGTKLNIALTQDTVQLIKKQKLSDKQLEKIKEFIKNRPEEVQNIYKTSLKYLNNEISNSDYIDELGVATEQILEKKIPVYKNEAKYLSDIALKTDMFHPAAVNEKFFNESAYYFLKQIKK